MNDDQTPDNKAAENTEEQGTNTPEPTEVEQDALNALVDVKGDVTNNEEPLILEEPDNDEEDDTDKGNTDKDDKDSSADSDTDAESDGSDDGSVDGAKDGGESANDSKDDSPALELETEADEAGVYEEPKTEDPGDFKPGDYSFTVTTADGKSHKISSIEEIDAFVAKLDDNPESITASQFSILNRKSALMEQGIASDKKAYDEQKTQHDQEQSLKETRESQLTQWNNEINYLANQDKLPKISDENNKANWSDPEVAKDPAVKARLDLLQWMNKENDTRLKSGLEPIHSLLDAHNAMRLEEIQTETKAQDKSDTTKRRQRGGKVGGTTPFTPENPPQNSIIGEGGPLSDLVNDYLLSQ